MLKQYSRLTEGLLKFGITLLAMLLACIIMYIQHGWINDDSVLYFEMARLFTIGEWKQGISLFNWPFYPTLISLVHKITNLSIQSSAQLLNVLFFGLSTFSFVRLIQLAGGKKTTMLCAAFLLFTTSYIVGDVLPMLLRDQGFWAMFLTSLVYFIQYYRQSHIKAALLWQIFAIFAVLFRIEAIVYLLGLPLLLLFEKKYHLKQRFNKFLIANTLSFFCFMAITCALLFLTHLHLSDFGRIQETLTIFPKIVSSINHTFSLKADIMGDKVLGRFLDNYGLLGLIVSLISIFIVKVISVAGWPVVGIFSLSRLQNSDKPSNPIQTDTRRIFNWVMLLALINALLIMVSEFILSSRYIIALGFIMLIFSSFKLENLLNKFSTIKPWQKATLLILLAVLTINGFTNLLPKGAGYNFEQDAVAYLKQQQVPNDKVFFVTPRARFFAGAPYAGRGYEYWDFIQNAISSGTIKQYDYLLLNIDIDAQYKEKQQYLSQHLSPYMLEKEFYGYNKKKKVMLYIKK